jgi:hypothetical protein
MEEAHTLAYNDTATITTVKGLMIEAPGLKVIMFFTAVIYYFYNKVVFNPGKPFQLSLQSKVRAYLNQASFTMSILQALPTNITLGWKSLLGTNTLAY